VLASTGGNMQRNVIGNLALVLSVIGDLLLFIFLSPQLLRLLPFVSLLCPLGLLLGIIALWRRPRRSAAWVIAFGIWGSLYVPTLFTALQL
jgi:hypothetical protein